MLENIACRNSQQLWLSLKKKKKKLFTPYYPNALPVAPLGRLFLPNPIFLPSKLTIFFIVKAKLSVLPANPCHPTFQLHYSRLPTLYSYKCHIHSSYQPNTCPFFSTSHVHFPTSQAPSSQLTVLPANPYHPNFTIPGSQSYIDIKAKSTLPTSQIYTCPFFLLAVSHVRPSH